MTLGRQLDFLTRLIPTWRKEPLPTPKQPEIRTASHRDDAMEAKARELLHALHYPELAKRVVVRWNSRMRSTAGTALVAKALITLNPRLCAIGESEVDRTLRHELAHLLAHHRAGRKRIEPHGPEWQQACRDLGLLDEKRCHTLPLPRRQLAARHFYRCPSCAQEVKRVRPFVRKTACLDCCRSHNRGRYDERFRFLKIPGPKK
ncbi:MAG: SprT-like domain-containing protein [Chthoniobacter sp.]